MKTLNYSQALEVGSGISPVSESSDKVIYSDLSPTAISFLSRSGYAKKGLAQSATELPIKDSSVDVIICSEVIEHIRDHLNALKEMYRVLKPGGTLLLTVPVQEKLFAVDDEFVNHHRRYEVSSLVKTLEGYGLQVQKTKNIAGILDKLAMMLAVSLFKLLPESKSKKSNHPTGAKLLGLKILLAIYKVGNFLYRWLVMVEAAIIPKKWSTIHLFRCQKI